MYADGRGGVRRRRLGRYRAPAAAARVVSGSALRGVRVVAGRRGRIRDFGETPLHGVHTVSAAESRRLHRFDDSDNYAFRIFLSFCVFL